MVTTSSTSLQPLENSKETLLGAALSLEQRYGCQPLLDKGTTLNTKFDVYPDALPANPSSRLVRYFSWGVGGRANDDTNLSSAEYAQGTNMSLYKPRPFRCVPFENDISATERAKYALREIRLIDGVPYCLYWLKRINFTQGPVQYVRTDPASGDREAYEIDYNNLTNPTPPPRGSNGVITDISDTISVILPASVTITGEEVLESVAVMDNGDPRYGIVSELGFVSAATETVNVTDFSGAPFPYQEAIFAQLCNHYNWVGQPFINTTDSYTRAINFSLLNIVNQT